MDSDPGPQNGAEAVDDTHLSATVVTVEMNEQLAALARTAHAQDGVFTRADAVKAGLSRSQWSRMLAGGHWVAAHPGVWRAATTPPTLALRERAALLWLGDQAALSHLSAARRYGLAVPTSGSVWVAVPAHVKPRPQSGVIVTRSQVNSRRILVGGVACVEPAHAVADLAQCTSAGVVKSALLSGVQRRLVTAERVGEICAQLGNRGGNGELRRLLQLFDPGLESWLEDLWAAGLSRLGFSGWTPQLRIALDSGTVVARADFGDAAARLAVQLDGFAYHSSVQQLRRDKAMDRAAARLGYLTVRFDADDVTRRLDECLREVEEIRADRLRRPAA